MIDTAEYKKHIYDVVGAIHEVHKELGAGLNEYCYQEGLQMQLEESGIPFQRELSFHPYYHGKEMSAEYRVDFLCKGDVVVECKSVAELVSNHRAQLFNYMRITRQHRGILFNFGEDNLHTERYLYLPKYDDFILLNQDNYRDYISD
jgi:GxxExxY protein